MGDQHRIDEVGLARRLAAAERGVGAFEACEQAAEAGELGFIEPGADATGVLELAVLVEADDERSEPAVALALAGQPAADHDVGLEQFLTFTHAACGARARTRRRAAWR